MPPRQRYHESDSQSDMDQVGLIYYVLDATRLGSMIKIGFTTNLNQRFEALASQTRSRQRPIVIGLHWGSIQRERELHARFSDHRAWGEWFFACRPLIGCPLQDHVGSLESPIAWLSEQPDMWRYAGGWQGFTGWRSYPSDGPMAGHEPCVHPLPVAIPSTGLEEEARPSAPVEF